MAVLHFESDYMEGAAPQILERLNEINLDKNPGYGSDAYCKSAVEKIRQACKCPEAEVNFLVGGTQTNATVIASLLKPWQGVVALETGHIAVHEAGAIEATGHKVFTLKGTDGKMSSDDLNKFLTTFEKDENNSHMIEPGLVYISYPTEYGSVYTKEELKCIHNVCTKHKIPLYLDGARMAYGLAAQKDVKLSDIAKYCDVFYIGGTKCGALFGEAVVCTKPGLLPHFFTQIKQHGALLAKGWLLGLQFDTLFTDDLYYKLGENAIKMAEYLKKCMKEKGVQFYNDSITNQQFFVMSDEKLKTLGKKAVYSFWEKYDESYSVIRFATSWATTKADVDKLVALI
ncbi:MAG: beta-eliminating lyase-related protein [Treponema sp.]|nr:beta-eliminating lyase-related protein [Treponema sp.]